MMASMDVRLPCWAYHDVMFWYKQIPLCRKQENVATHVLTKRDSLQASQCITYIFTSLEVEAWSGPQANWLWHLRSYVWKGVVRRQHMIGRKVWLIFERDFITMSLHGMIKECPIGKERSQLGYVFWLVKHQMLQRGQSRSIEMSCTKFSLINGSASSLGSRCTEPFCNKTDPMLSTTSPKSLSTRTDTFGSLGGSISCKKSALLKILSTCQCCNIAPYLLSTLSSLHSAEKIDVDCASKGTSYWYSEAWKSSRFHILSRNLKVHLRRGNNV